MYMHPDLVVGKRFPDLTLPDHRHQPVTLSELAGGFPLIVSFYRGYW
jgi:peroxiredoxin